MAKVFAPNKEYTGIIAGVLFTNGVGETEDKWLLMWFEENGYKIVGDEDAWQSKSESTATSTSATQTTTSQDDFSQMNGTKQTLLQRRKRS